MLLGPNREDTCQVEISNEWKALGDEQEDTFLVLIETKAILQERGLLDNLMWRV